MAISVKFLGVGSRSGVASQDGAIIVGMSAKGARGRVGGGMKKAERVKEALRTIDETRGRTGSLTALPG